MARVGGATRGPGFRDARAEDVQALVSLINAAYQVEELFVAGPRTSVAEIEEILRGGGFLLAEEDGRAVGCVYVGRRGGRGYFGLLSVEPSRQGRGLGRRLVEAAEARLREQGHREVEILVVDARTELFPFYAGLGYGREGEEPFPEGYALRIPCRFVVMRKTLD
jgi:N-acetylglutamate synthase-like GNAT family acetyltransferase